MTRKLGAELFGTATLVFVGCGVAVLTLGSWHSGFGTGAGIVATALAFGLVLAGLAYAIGPVSGCHVNPAVTFGVALSRRMSWSDAAGYWAAQFVGGVVGAGLLDLVLRSSPMWSKAIGLGADGYGSASMIHVSAGGAFLVEAILTAIFVFVILSVTGRSAPIGVAGLIIGLTLAFVHLFGIAVTGTSVNPARSLGPALFLGGTALHQVWLFILAPLVGGAAAALLHRGLHGVTD
ncbi:MAG: aquaporin [Acidimicrobiales bacterium]